MNKFTILFLTLYLALPMAMKADSAKEKKDDTSPQYPLPFFCGEKDAHGFLRRNIGQKIFSRGHRSLHSQTNQKREPQTSIVAQKSRIERVRRKSYRGARCLGGFLPECVPVR